MTKPDKPKRRRTTRPPTLRQKIGGLALAIVLIGFPGWQLFSAAAKGEMYGRGSLVLKWETEPVLFVAIALFYLLLFGMGLVLFAGLALSATAAPGEGVRLVRWGRPDRRQVEVEMPPADEDRSRSR